MTEEEWLASEDPRKMLEWVWPDPEGGLTSIILPPALYQRKTSGRKLRLFCCACSRLIVPHVFQKHIDRLESEGPGDCTDHEWAMRWVTTVPDRSKLSAATQADLLRHVIGPTPFRPVWSVRCERCDGYGQYKRYLGHGDFDEPDCLSCSGRGYLPAPRPSIPAVVERLAEAMYEGEDCAFALHDVLLDAGIVEMAGHFARCEKPAGQSPIWHHPVNHPKGCWAVDTILNKE